jgi:hypothetical protein
MGNRSRCISAPCLSGKTFGIYRYTACAKQLIANMMRFINSHGIQGGGVAGESPAERVARNHARA